MPLVIKEPSELTSIYREVLSYPTPTDAHVSLSENGKSVVIQSVWSQRDVERNEKSTLVRSHTVDTLSNQVIAQSDPQEINNELWNKASPSGKLRAVVRSGKDKKGEDKQYLEIFDSTRKLKTVDVLALEKHGKIVEKDGQFGSFEWASSEGHIMYIAEKKKPTTGSFFDPKAFKAGSSGDEDSPSTNKADSVERGDDFLYRESWGEQLTDRIDTVICVMDIVANTVSLLENFPEDVCPGQAIWAPDDAGIVACGWTQVPYKLGLRFCCQRKSALYFLDLQKGQVEILSEEGRAVMFPRFSPNMRRLVYLDIPEGGPHNQCARLIKVDWTTRARSIVVDQVGYASAPNFPGIHTYAVSPSVWLDDNIHLALETFWRSSMAVIIVNTDTGSVCRLRKDSETGSMGLLCVKSNYLVLKYSSPSQPFYLLLAHIPKADNLDAVTWIYLDGQPEPLDWLTWSVLLHKPTPDRRHPKFEEVDYESILCLPTKTDSDQLPPLIVFSHGGPNVAFDTSFLMITNFFCRCGFAVIMVNYRGSLGFGQDSVLSLLGNIGHQDVKDVESVMVEVVAKGVVDGNRIFAFGGSHGGFLTTHLIGQYPDTFKAAASRNPVINLASMFSTTDIKDWIFYQSGLTFDYRSLADDKLLQHLWLSSPLSHVDKVKTPMMLMIGLEDKRVPPSQGKEYYHALKARGVPVRYLTYPGCNHGISDVDAEADCMMNTVMWFNRYMA